MLSLPPRADLEPTVIHPPALAPTTPKSLVRDSQRQANLSQMDRHSLLSTLSILLQPFQNLPCQQKHCRERNATVHLNKLNHELAPVQQAQRPTCRRSY